MLIFLLQTDAKSYGFLWERYGLAAVILLVVGLGIWKWVLPLISKLIETLNKQLEEARAAREGERKDFLASLERITTKHEVALGKMAESFDGLRDEVRRKGSRT